MINVVTWERHESADTASRRGYRWISTNSPGGGVVTVPTAWAHQVDTITAEVTAAATEQLGVVTVHPAARAAAEQATGLVYLAHSAHVRDRFWVDVHAGHQQRLKIWRSEHRMGAFDYVLASSSRHTLHRIDCPTMRASVHGLDLMTRIRKLRRAAELDQPISIQAECLNQLDVDATLAWVWRGPRPHLLTADDATRITDPSSCRTCLPTYHLPGEQPPVLTADILDHHHLGRELTTADGTLLGELVAITRRMNRHAGGGQRVETRLEFAGGRLISINDDVELVLVLDNPSAVGSGSAS